MQHHPDVLILVQAELDEVVAAAERAELTDPGLRELALHLHHAGVLADDHVQAIGQLACGALVGAAAHLAGFVLIEADRHCGLDRAAEAVQAVRQLGRSQRKPHRVHAAADVYTDSGRNDGLPGRDYAAHGRADAAVDVRHRRNVRVHERQL